MPWAVVAAVAGAGISAYASGEAADTQADAAKDATALQKYIFDQQTALQQPWLQAGGAGLNKLSYMLGLSPVGFGGGASGGGSGLPTMESPEQIRRRLVQQYTTQNTTYAPGGFLSAEEGGGATPGAPITNSVIDEQALSKAIAAEQAKQKAAYDAALGKAQQTAGNDPLYGSLLDKFDMEDFEADPGYKFRMQEGQKALERSAAARGGLLSGRAIKDTLRFGQGLGAQEYGAAFDRFNVQNTNTFNRLASISGVGQTAANQTGAAAGQYGMNAANNIIGAGNAQAAGMVGGANAINNGISQGYSMYQGNQLMNMMNRPSGSYQGFNTSVGGGGGFGTGSSYGNQDYGQYL